ncbi:MAG TPA: hypothetical protein VEW66_00820, partial [Thermomicrobiales bacterium]|nr:hypothetical protein [Thermomicrobiales bacterium]
KAILGDTVRFRVQLAWYPPLGDNGWLTAKKYFRIVFLSLSWMDAGRYRHVHAANVLASHGLR